LATFVKAAVEKVGGFFKSAGKKKIIIISSVVAFVLIVGIVGAVLLNRKPFTVLYSGLDAAEAGTIKKLLDDMGVESKVQGSVILVPEERADELRLELASQGYPKTGLNYEIFSNSSALGTTDLERKTYQQYQLQENMRSTLRHMEKIDDCIVIVNLAESSSFVISDARKESSVSVMLKLKDGAVLTDSEARAIAQFVLTCVPNLKLENVSIVDSNMKAYNISPDEEAEQTEAAQTVSAMRRQMTEDMKNALTKQVLNVLEPAIGTGNVSVSVNVVLDFDKQTIDKVEFTPSVPGETEGIIRSLQESYTANSPNASFGGAVGGDTNGVGTPVYVGADDEEETTYFSGERTYNYEINEIKTRIEKAEGSVKDLSVAVLINSNVKGVEAYAATIEELVSKAIGVSEEYVSVAMIPFFGQQGVPTTPAEPAPQGQGGHLSTFLIAALALLAVAGLTAALIISRKKQRAALALAGGPAAQVALTSEDLASEEEEEEDDFDLTEMMQRRSSETEKVEELMDRYPEIVAQVLRAWLTED